MRLLIIEDNQQIARGLKGGLKSAYAVDVVHTGQDGLRQAESVSYDAIILDLGLPDIDGARVCKAMRANGISVPILVLTAEISTATKVKLLDMGADDYVTKPFKLEEVGARLRALMRRAPQQAASSKLAVADLELDTAQRTVHRGDTDIMLRRKEFDLLEYLMRNQGRTVTRPMIVEHVWDMNEDLWTNVVDVHIKHLRDKIDRPFPNKLIRTVHGVGYKLEAVKGVAERRLNK